MKPNIYLQTFTLLAVLMLVAESAYPDQNGIHATNTRPTFSRTPTPTPMGGGNLVFTFTHEISNIIFLKYQCAIQADVKNKSNTAHSYNPVLTVSYDKCGGVDHPPASSGGLISLGQCTGWTKVFINTSGKSISVPAGGTGKVWIHLPVLPQDFSFSGSKPPGIHDDYYSPATLEVNGLKVNVPIGRCEPS